MWQSPHATDATHGFTNTPPIAARGLRPREMTAAIGFCICVLAIHSFRSVHHERKAADEIERLDGKVHYAWRLDERIQVVSAKSGLAPGWLLPGDAFAAGVFLPYCHKESLDQKLACLKRLRNLRWLDLSNAGITDAALVHVAGLARLKWLSLSFTPITDEGVCQLESLARLNWLDLTNTRVTDNSLPRLAMLVQLERLKLRGTRVSRAGVAWLRKQLPKARIETDFDGDRPSISGRTSAACGRTQSWATRLWRADPLQRSVCARETRPFQRTADDEGKMS